MRPLITAVAIIIFAAGCTTKTTVIKSHPIDEAPQSIHQSETIAAGNHLEQGKQMYYRGEFTQATKHLVRSIASNHENWEAHYYLGLVQQKTGRYDRAIGSFNNSLKYGPPDAKMMAQINYCLGISWENEGYWEKAKEKFSLALQFDPKLDGAKSAVDRVSAKAIEAKKSKKDEGDHAY
jgi:tetratricopeptide (TPR) repeat protein